MRRPEDLNSLIGSNVARLRRAKGISQLELANRLFDAGLPFQQPTVLKIEKGTRPLRAEELYFVALVLEVEIADLFAMTTEEARRAELLLDLARIAREIAETKTEIRARDVIVGRLEAEYRTKSAEYSELVGDENAGPHRGLADALKAEIERLKEERDA